MARRRTRIGSWLVTLALAGAAGAAALAGCDNNPWPHDARGDQHAVHRDHRELAAAPGPDRFVLEQRHAVHLPGLRAAVRLPLPEAPVRAGAQDGRARSSQPYYFDKDGQPLPDDAPAEQIAESVYDVPIKPGMLLPAAPGLRKDEQGRYRYHAMKPGDVGDTPLADAISSTRARANWWPRISSTPSSATPRTRITAPIYGIFAEYIVGLQASTAS